MLSVNAALTLYDGATRIQTIGSWIAYLLPQQDALIQELLETMAERVDALVEPLNFCLLWSQKRGTCVSNVAFQARTVLSTIEDFIRKCAVTQKNKGKFDHDSMVSALKKHLRRLEFAISSVNLAVTVLHASHTMDQNELTFSPSALLRSSNRIKEMYHTGGDLTNSTGRLYILKPEHRRRADDAKAPDTPTWELICSNAIMKIFHKLATREFQLRIEVERSDMYKEQDLRSRFPLEKSLGFEISSKHKLGLRADEFDGKSLDDVDVGLVSMVNMGADVAFTWVEMIANQVQTRYAFVLSEHLEQASVSLTGGPALKLRPIDVLYVVRLCIYENLNPPPGHSKDKALPSHIGASDEELKLIVS